MILMGINLANIFLNNIRPMQLKVGNSSQGLKCRIVELQEQQNYQLPMYPLDDGTFINDTIYKLPKMLNLRVFVESSNLDSFLKAINQAQFSDKLFTVISLNNEVFKNFKVLSYAKDVNSTMINAYHYNLQLQEVKMVKALAQSYKSSSNVGYSSNKYTGNKSPAPQKKSALLEGSNMLGYLK